MSIGLFLIFFAACSATAATGSLFPTGAWYEKLRKPIWTPPNWAFPIAWTLLYIILSFVGMRAALAPNGQTALALWALQGSLATLWTPVFFGLKKNGNRIFHYGLSLGHGIQHDDFLFVSRDFSWNASNPLPVLGFVCCGFKLYSLENESE